MTSRTVAVYAATQGFGVDITALIGMMLVFMMPKMLSGLTGFVLAIATDRRPGELERQKNEKKDGKPATHLVDVSRTIGGQKQMAKNSRPGHCRMGGRVCQK